MKSIIKMDNLCTGYDWLWGLVQFRVDIVNGSVSGIGGQEGGYSEDVEGS